MSGSRVTLRTALTTSYVPRRLQPNWMPPSLMFGHEMFSSMAATPSASDRIRDTSAYSSIVVPQTLTMTVAPRARSSGSFSSTNRRTPMPCRPMAFSMPGRRFDDARRRVAFALGEEQALDGDAAERRQIDEVGVLDAVAEAAAGRDERILQRQRADANGKIHGVLVSPTRSDRPPAPGRRGTIARDGSAPCSSRIGTTQL